MTKLSFGFLQVPVAAGQIRMENGVEADNMSVIKNWRHTMGPGQLSSAQDDGVRVHAFTHSGLQRHALTVSHNQGVAAGRERKL